jgi:hypothetical protein
MSICKASEISRDEAYIEVRRSASGPEGRGMRVTQQMGVFPQPLSWSERQSGSRTFLTLFVQELDR